MKKFLTNTVLFLAFFVMMNYILFSYFGFLDEKPQTVSENVIELPPFTNHRVRLTANDPEVLCMAENIFHEARNQSEEGMIAVGFVTVNRKNHANYPNTICEVVYDPYQFSWTLDAPVINLNNKIERKAWNKIVNISLAILNEDIYNNMYGVTHYHTTEVNPVWNRDKALVYHIDDHLFYASY
jgi:spore germination cell wall hydrolase CwlJ-like protein